jgi:2-polyprenyl-3-methyl-5-hydroxy-6-metoxy-1,4-benzoquinol methylase
MNPDEIEQELASEIDPWLQHMRWRADFQEWRRRRLWQENYQTDTLREIRRYGGPASALDRVLDLGAGMGGLAVALMRDSRDVIAADYNISYCEIARTRARRYGLSLATLVSAGEALPFASESFGILTCLDVVEHVNDPTRLLSEIARVLNSDGRAFMTAINRFALVDPHYHLRFVNWLPRPIGERYIAWRQRTKDSPLRDRQKLGEMHYFTLRGITRLAAQQALVIEDLNAPRSRLRALPKPFGGLLYAIWRSFGMGTFRFILRKAGSLNETAR